MIEKKNSFIKSNYQIKQIDRKQERFFYAYFSAPNKKPSKRVVGISVTGV